jgi:GTP-binding protein
MTFSVAIIGRPNVGKSTLFNRLVGRRLAIVHDRPGVTRDRREGTAYLLGLNFTVIDTAGLEEAASGTIEARMRQQTDMAIGEADVVLMLIDARAGVTPLDAHFGDLLRKVKKPVILVANKCEGKAGAPGLYESYGLGLGEPVPISAEHGEGLADLYDAIALHAPPSAFDHNNQDDQENAPFEEEAAEDRAAANADDDAPEEELDPGRPLQLAIVGRPNVGKSTLVNHLLGEERMITGPEAGLTRDAVTVEWTHSGQRFRLVDTAGLRKRANVFDPIEKLSVADTLHAIRHAQIVVLVMDAGAILDKQDLTIARMVIDEGRGLVIAINKWDIVENKADSLARLKDRLESSLAQAKGVSTVTISALTGSNLDRLMDAVLHTYKVWNKRISTGKLNRWLGEVTTHHPPPALHGGRRIKLRFMTQVKARPPTFVIFASKPEDLPESYSRYLIAGLRDVFDLPGVPLRIFIRKGRNPYAD